MEQAMKTCKDCGAGHNLPGSYCVDDRNRRARESYRSRQDRALGIEEACAFCRAPTRPQKLTFFDRRNPACDACIATMRHLARMSPDMRDIAFDLCGYAAYPTYNLHNYKHIATDGGTSEEMAILMSSAHHKQPPLAPPVTATRMPDPTPEELAFMVSGNKPRPPTTPVPPLIVEEFDETQDPEAPQYIFADEDKFGDVPIGGLLGPPQTKT